MRFISVKLTATLLLTFAIALNTLTSTVGAVTGADWRAGNIIEDFVFTRDDSMSVSQIQSWLNARLANCDEDGSEPSEFGGGTRAQYGAAHGNPAPFTCLNKYYEVPKTTPGSGTPASNYGGKPIPTGAKSAARLIYDAARAHDISPKVLLVKLGTESAGPLTSDTWPFKKQYTYAMGAHCPDSGPGGSANCDSDYAGFSIQMREAASLLRWYLDSMDESWWSYKKPYTTNYVLWNVQPSGCGGKNIYISNKATAALYTYTPYQPNTAALNNLYGTGNSCSAYGNRNFWRVYNDWFGSTYGTESDKAYNAIEQRYTALGGNTGVLGSQKSPLQTADHTYWKRYANGYIIWSSSTGAWESMGPIRDRWEELGLRTGKLGLPAGKINTNPDGSKWQVYENGYITGSDATGYWESMGSIRNRWVELGLKSGVLGLPAGPVNYSTPGYYWQVYENGYIVGQGSTGYWESMGPIRDRWVQLGLRSGVLGIPTGPVNTNPDGSKWQSYQHGYVTGNSSTGYWESMGPIRDRWVQLGLRSGVLGHPTGSVTTNPDGGVWQPYENGYIVGQPSTGAWESMGPIRDRWVQLGLRAGKLGYPIGPIVNNPDGSKWQTYQHGSVVGDGTFGYWESLGPIRNYWASTGYRGGTLGTPTGPVIVSGTKQSQDYQSGDTVNYTSKNGIWLD